MRSQSVCRAPRVFVNTNRRAVRIEGDHRNIRVDEFESATLELKVTNNLRQERPDAIRERRVKAGMEFFSDARAADHVSTLKHERFESRLREIVSGDKAVVAAADDDDVALWHRRKLAAA